jgi:hypothetical protein
MAESFKVDPKIAEIAAAYSLDAVDTAASNFGVELDWSDNSVRKVEEMLGRLHDDIVQSNPPEEAVWKFAKEFGSYVGEVLCRHHGGEWGMVNLNGQEFPGIKQDGDRLCWPWARAHKRIVNGPEDDIWHYYQVLLNPSAGPEAPNAPEPPKKPWWRFW